MSAAIADKPPTVVARHTHASTRAPAVLLATRPHCGEGYATPAHTMPLDDADERIKARCSKNGKGFLLQKGGR